MSYIVYRVVRSRVGWAVANGADTLTEFNTFDAAHEDAIRRANEDLEQGLASSYEVLDAPPANRQPV